MFKDEDIKAEYEKELQEKEDSNKSQQAATRLVQIGKKYTKKEEKAT